MMYAVMEEDAPRPSSMHPSFPRELEAIILKALQRNRDNRYTSALDMANDLRRVAHDNDWDIEAQALSDLVTETIPADEVAFGRIGSSDAFSGGGPSGSRKHTTYGSGDDSFASLEVVAEDDANNRTLLITTLVMAILSAIFWIFIVPVLI
jgi:serine/threonine-protein kinase